MSAFGSSVINKSGKKFAPKKAPSRRTAGVESESASKQQSLDKQTQSQTPQPVSSPRPPVSSSAPHVATHTGKPSGEAPSAARADHEGTSDVVRISAPSRTTSIELQASSIISPQERHSENHLYPTPRSTATPVAQTNLDATPTVNGSHDARVEHPSNRPKSPKQASGKVNPDSQHQQVSTSPAGGHDALAQDTAERPSKRQKRVAAIVPDTTPAQETTGPNAPIPTIEVDPTDTTEEGFLQSTLRAVEANARKNARKSNSQSKHLSRTPGSPDRASDLAVEAEPAIEPGDESQSQAKRKKPSKTKAHGRKRPVEEEAEPASEPGEGSQSQAKRKRPSKTKAHGRKRPVEEEAEPPSEPGEGSQSQARGKRPSKTKAHGRKRPVEEEAAAIVDAAVQGTTKDHRKRGRRSKRADTPEDAENERISTADTTMVELCRDTRRGRKSSRERRLREMDRAAFVAKKQRQLQELVDQEASPAPERPVEPAQPEEAHENRQKELEHTVVQQVPRTIIVDGRIRIDPDSLRIDRHAAAALEREQDGEVEAIDENDLSRKVTSGSWLKRDQSGRWNELLLERFYQGLRMFGTDFEMISKMFPGKTRHSIKLKFCKEEKLDYPRIKAALLGEKEPVVLEEYEKMTGAEYEDPRELERVMEEDRKILEEEQAVEKQAMEDAEREREAQAEAEREAVQEDTGNQSEGKRGKKMKRGRDKQQRRTKKSKSPGKGFLQGVGKQASRDSIAAAA